jgi:large subunit ribosomal protein L22
MVKYAFEVKENMAKAYGQSLGISTKKSVEICRHIRNMKVVKAKKFLERVMKMEEAVPFKRYLHDIPHRTGMAAGKYPITAAEEILKIIKSAESNAQSKGLATPDLTIVHISAHLASRPYHYGRKKRSKMKRTHIQVVLEEKRIKND